MTGNLNQAELSWVIDPMLSPPPATAGATPPPSLIPLHNDLIMAIYANTLRDPPPTEVAPWVVATDKPTSTSKNAASTGANDKAEERLKTEVMSLQGRDRRRIKSLKDGGKPVNDGFAELQAYRHELAVKAPDTTPHSAGGTTRTNCDVEIRRRYQQPLAQETLEFPTPAELQSRLEPISYEQGLAGGVAPSALQASTSLVDHATQVHAKALMGQMFAHTRSNADGCIRTRSFARRHRREAADVRRGALEPSAQGLLPVELEAHAASPPLARSDLRLAAALNEPLLRHPGLRESLADLPAEFDAPLPNGTTNGTFHAPQPNGHATNAERARHAVTSAAAAAGPVGSIPAVEAAAAAVRAWRHSDRPEADDDLMAAFEDCLGTD